MAKSRAAPCLRTERRGRGPERGGATYGDAGCGVRASASQGRRAAERAAGEGRGFRQVKEKGRSPSRNAVQSFPAQVFQCRYYFRWCSRTSFIPLPSSWLLKKGMPTPG